MNLVRGFRRIAWVTVLLAVPPIVFLAYEASERVVGYKARLLVEDFPRLDDTFRQPMRVKDVGIVWFPSYLTKAQVETRMLAIVLPPEPAPPDGKQRVPLAELAQTLGADKTYTGGDDDVTLVKRILTDRPEYRSRTQFAEYEVDEISAKRPFWTAGVAMLAIGIVAAVLHGIISLCAWIGRGFQGRS